MAPENIISTMRKILTMAERGTKQEALVARAKLNNLLQKHKMTIEDLIEPEKKRYDFAFKDAEEKSIIFQCYSYMKNTSSISYFKYKGKGSRTIGFDLTPSEAIRMQDLVETYKKAWRKEIKQVKKDLVTAFMSKHQLFNHDPNEENDSKPLSPEEIARIRALASNLKDVQKPNIKIGD